MACGGRDGDMSYHSAVSYTHLARPKRISGKRMIFFVFQGNTFDKEFNGGYIWAPISNKAGNKFHHWKKLLDVRAGDIILHGCDG